MNHASSGELSEYHRALIRRQRARSTAFFTREILRKLGKRWSFQTLSSTLRILIQFTSGLILYHRCHRLLSCPVANTAHATSPNKARRDQSKYKPEFRSQPIRKTNPLIDDSAVESDGEGGDVASRESTAASSRPSSLVHTPKNLSVQVLITKAKTTLKRPKEHWQTCNRFFDGIKQLEIHLRSKKHLKQVRNSVRTHCKQCNHIFTSKHNLANHKCENIRKKESRH